MMREGCLVFGQRAWDPAEHGFGKALALTRDRAEREELERLEDLARNARLTRREIDGLARYLVLKTAQIRGIDLDAREVTVVASDKTVDRYGDTIDPNGWDVSEYRKNPVVLIDHRYDVRSIVGQSLKEWVDEEKFLMRHKLDGPANAEASMVMARLASGSLRATSVGFRPTKWAKRYNAEDEWTGGYDYIAQELLEDSYVAVPANPNALVAAGKGLDASRSQEPQAATSVSRLAEIDRRLRLAAIAQQLGA
jgi:HK97 family phage prohead protease